MAATVWPPRVRGRTVGLVDDNPDLGGQIWRGERARPSSPEAASWFARIKPASTFEAMAGTRVVGPAGPGVAPGRVRRGRLVELGYRAR